MGIGQATSANVRQHQPRPARIGRGLRTSLSRRRAWPGRIALGLHTTVGRGLTASAVACTQRPADVGRGLPTSAVACTTFVDNMRMSMSSKNLKSVKHPSCITTYSSISHHLCSTFPPHVVRSCQSSLLLRFIIFYVAF